MAANFYGGQITVTGTAATLYDLLDAIGEIPSNALDRVTANVTVLRADSANAGTVYIGAKSTVATTGTVRGAFLEPGEWISYDATLTRIDIKSIWLVGTPNDTVFVTCVEY